MNEGIRLEKVISRSIDGKEEVCYRIVQGIGVRTIQITLEQLEHLAAIINSLLKEEKGGGR